MTDMMKWFERKFSLDLPVWMFPSLLERLRGTPARVEDLTHDLSQEVLFVRAGESSWSIQENVGHLLDLEPLWAGRVDDILAGKERMTPADLTNRKTYEANHNATSIKGIVTSFREARTAFVHRLEDLDDASIEKSAMHPRLEQPMRILDLISFVVEHDDHHLARISSLKRESKDLV